MVKYSSREFAVNVLQQTFRNQAYINLLLPKKLAKSDLSAQEKAFVTEIVYGVIRFAYTIDQIISEVAKRKLTKIYPDLLAVARSASYELLLTDTPAYAVLNSYVELCKKNGRIKQAGFINAVLHRISEADFSTWIDRLCKKNTQNELEKLSLIYAIPPAIIVAFLNALQTENKSELTELLTALNIPPTVELVALPGKITARDLLKEVDGGLGTLSPFAVNLKKGREVRTVSALKQQLARVQDEGSQLIAWILATIPLEIVDNRWLDLCAGPGGKTAMLVALAENFSKSKETNKPISVLAIEVNTKRAQLVRNTIDSPLLEVKNLDGRTFNSTSLFSRILVDAPCSGLGSIRRRVDLRLSSENLSKKVADLVELQLALLKNSLRLVSPGGVVAYATCTPVVAETVGVVTTILAELGNEISLLDLHKFNKLWKLPDSCFQKLESGSVIQLWTHKHHTDSMFLAVFKRYN